jgi:hypothetical protein
MSYEKTPASHLMLKLFSENLPISRLENIILRETNRKTPSESHLITHHS